MFRRLAVFGVILLAAALGGYALQRAGDTPSAAPVQPLAPGTPPAAASPARPTPLVSDLAPYADATALLDGVCFEALAALSGQSWVWRSQADLDAFYVHIDAAAWCPEPIARQTYDFAGSVLAGTAIAAQGCDAAFRSATLAAAGNGGGLVLRLALQVIPGCPYELIEPVIVVLPAPAADTPLTIEIISAF